MRCLSIALILLLSVDKVLLQPEKVQWELEDASLSDRALLRSLLAFQRRNNHLNHNHHHHHVSMNSRDADEKTNVAKKGLGVFSHGRPSLFYKSLFAPSSSESFGGFASTRLRLDRPRPLRWG